MKTINRKTKTTASVLAVLLGLSGALNHGLFEILQGYTSTDGFFIEAISEEIRFWEHGTEAAFTLIHNFLFTGIAAVLIGLITIFWSINYLHKPSGATFLLILFILLTLSGGGIGYIVLFIPVWAFATRINKPLTWWRKVLSGRLGKMLSRIWPYSLFATSLSWLMVMQLGIFGYFPGYHDPDTILSIVFLFLFATDILAIISFISAIAGDIELQQDTEDLRIVPAI